MIIFVQAILRLLAAFVGLNALPVRRRRSVEAENRFLRRELALYQERGVRPRGVDAATRALLALLYRLFDWGHALAVVRHETLIRWHQVGWRLFWRPNGPDRISAEHNGIAFIEVPIKRGQL
jgi:putative transposase